MENNMDNRIEKYLDMLNQLKGKVSDERTAMGLLAEICKDKRMEEMKQEREQRNHEPATQKQINFLKKLGVDVSKHPYLTKRQASELIDEELDA